MHRYLYAHSLSYKLIYRLFLAFLHLPEKKEYI